MPPRSRPATLVRTRRIPVDGAPSGRATRHASTAVAIGLAAVFLLPGPLPPAPAPAAPRHQRIDSMPGPENRSLLVSYYDSLMEGRDLDAFESRVEARYTQGTLVRLLQSGGVRTRRAAVLALGQLGDFGVNAALAGAMKDEDSGVRELAVKALWSVWTRADTPENNEMLGRVSDLIALGRFREAEAMATRLIRRAPDFAEAYNQRAIAFFSMGRYAESAADCLRTLDLNPYHIGALSGLGQCYLRLDRREDALEAFRRGLELQPFNFELRQTVTLLEGEAP